MFNAQRLRLNDLQANEVAVKAHQWVAVPSPMHKRALLHACDDCGVVRSENTLMKNCAAEPKQRIITSALLVIVH